MQKRILILWLALTLPFAGWAIGYEQDFHAVQQHFTARDKQAADELATYLKKYPYTPYADEVKMMQGVLQTEKKKYKRADKIFHDIDAQALSRQGLNQYYFYWGYALIEQQQYAAALDKLAPLILQRNEFQKQAQYYVGYCFYCQGNYALAQTEFLDLDQQGAFGDVVPYYILQIDFAQGRYDEVMTRSQELLERYPTNEHNAELLRQRGEISYNRGDYATAADALQHSRELLVRKKKDLPRTDIYLLGISHYKQGAYAQAAEVLRQVANQNDSISENTCLHLGHCYLRLGEEEKARLSYSAAMQLNINPTLREEAMFNYVQIAYHQGSALGESIRAFRDFLTQYPHTRHRNEVNALLADMLMTSKDYQGAYEALQQISTPTAHMQETKQYLRYQIGVDAYLQKKYDAALDWLNQVLLQDKQSSSFRTEALYIIAECQYRQNQYDACLQTIQQFEKQSQVKQSKNYPASQYLKAYAYFNNGLFTQAIPVLEQYCTLVPSPDRSYLDAQNRIGDCHFHMRHFQQAIQAYQINASHPGFGADYALFQMGYAHGLLHQYEKKAAVMKELTTRYPKSTHAADAYYEQARAFLQLDEPQAAISSYEQILQRFPHASKAGKASLEMAMAFRSLHQYDQAVQTYESTIRQYAGTPEAYSALKGLEQLCVETNRLNDYLLFTQQLDALHMQATTQEDSLVYTTAEVQYLKGNYEQAAQGLQIYMDKYCPDGRYCVQATYYRANSYYQLNQYDAALEQYVSLTQMPHHSYQQEANLRAAELYFDKEQYAASAPYFHAVAAIASSAAVRITALVGEVRCHHHLNDYPTLIQSATTLLDESSLPDSVRTEGLYLRAMAYIAQGAHEQAIADLVPLAKEVRTYMGAEAQYRIAQCLFDMGQDQKAEQEIMAFTQKPTTQQYWLARSLILLSDIFVQRNDLFQAKQYLLTLQNNYHHTDDIATLVNQRLEVILQAEQKQEQEFSIENAEN